MRPIAYDWRLPDRHGNLYYYQKLLLNIPFRDETPTALVSRTPADATLPSNPRGSMREECVCRGLILNGDLDEVVRREAEKRLFMPEQIQSMVDRVSDFVAKGFAFGSATGYMINVRSYIGHRFQWS